MAAQQLDELLMGKTWAFPQPLLRLGIRAGKRLVKLSRSSFKPELPFPLVSKKLKGLKGNSLLPSPPPPCYPYEKTNKSAYQQLVQVNLFSLCSDVVWPKIKINNKFLTMEKNENMRKPTALLTQQVYLYYISQQLYLVTRAL